MKWNPYALAALVATLPMLLPLTGHAQPVPPISVPQEVATEAALSEQINAKTVSIITGTLGGSYFRIGADLAFVLNDGNQIRVLPILGKGAGENAYDLRFLKGVDLAFVRTDTLDQLRQDKRLKRVERHIHYIAKLFDDELHVVAARDVQNIRQLAGKRVSFDVKGSGTDYSGHAMFRGLGVAVETVNVDQPTALRMLRDGEVQAVVSVAAKPVPVLTGFARDERFHLVPVSYSNGISEAYVPATLAREDYPNLIDGPDPVETLAVGTVLGVYNHPRGSERYRRLKRFVEALFSRFDELLAPQRHPKWREVNLAASVASWTRFRPAQDWLNAHRDDMTPRAEVEWFLSEQLEGAAADKEQVYRAYLQWRSARRAKFRSTR